MVFAAEFVIGGTFSAVNKDIHLDSGKPVVPNDGLKFEAVESHAQDRRWLHRICQTVISEKVVSNHRIAPWTLKNLVLLSDPAI
jgi:hypothetical protein